MSSSVDCLNQDRSEVLKSEQLRTEYRSRLASVLKKASHYHGKQSEYEALLSDAIALEHWLQSVFKMPDVRLPEEIETEVANQWHTAKVRRDIDGILSLAGKSYEKYLTQSLSEKPSPLSDLVITEVDGVILPPSFQSRLFTNGQESREDHEVRFQARIKQLLLLLEVNGIYSDDVILVKGQLADTMMRKESYVIIEIPRLNREILVNRQVGEATFVIYGILGRDTLFSKTKEDLQNDFGSRVRRIVYRNTDQWQQELISTLLKDVDINSLQKINVKEQEAMRTEILRQVPTPQEWADMNKKEKEAFQVWPYKLYAIARQFGVQGDPISKPIHLELGRAVYGEGHECLQYTEPAELTPDELKSEIFKQVPAPRDWADMKYKEKKAFQVGPYKLYAIARQFGVQGDPIGKHSIHLELGRAVYGEGHECLQYTEPAELNPEELKSEILRQIPAPQDWADMTTKEKKAFQAGPYKLYAIARQFGVQGDPISKPIHLELGRTIYGEEHGCLNEFTPEELKSEILRQIPAPQEWADMNNKEKKAFQAGPYKLKAIATRFGVKGNPISKPIHLELGRAVYGEGHECLQYTEPAELTPDELKSEIFKQVPAPRDWADMNKKEKKAFQAGPYKLMAIARQFGVQGDPIGKHSIHLELGRAVYGEGHECLQYTEPAELNPEELKSEILRQIPAPQEWADMNNKEKKAFQAGPYKLYAIATRFGVQGNPISKHSIHLELGRAIYGEECECLK